MNLELHGSYTRNSPAMKEANRTTLLGKVNKCSRKLIVMLLTQSVTHFRNCSSSFDNFYTRLKKGKSYGKTRMALIWKIMVCAYYRLKKEESFKWNNTLKMDYKSKKFKLMAKRGEKKLKMIA